MNKGKATGCPPPTKYKTSDIFDFIHFESLSEMVLYCDKGIMDDERRHGNLSSQTYKNNGWAGTRDYPEASKLVRNGWPEGCKDMEKHIDIISEGIGIVEVKRPEYDVCGPIPDVGAYCSGDPECMINPAEVQDRPVINILFDVAASATVKPDNMTRRGAAILALAQRLELGGRSTAIYAVHADHFDEGIHLTVVCLKQADADFNLHSLSYAMTSPAFLRRHIFRIIERCKDIDNPDCQAYGRPLRLDSIDGVENAIGDIDLYIPKIPISGFQSDREAMQNILALAREAEIIS